MSRLSFLLLAAFVVLGAYCIDLSLAHKTGQTASSRTGCGQGCHGFSSSDNTTVTIWADSAQMTAGKQYKMHISVVNSIQTQVSGGCDISADNGAKLAVNGTGSGLFLSNGELTHTSPKSKSGDSITWTFLYTPSKAGTAHIYAAGNAVNGDGRESTSDMWNTTSFTTTIVAAAPTPSISVPTIFRDSALVGATNTKTLWVKNTGTAALTIDHYGLKSGSAWWISDSTTHSVPASDSIAVKLSFQPTGRLSYTDTLHIWSNDGTNSLASIPLVGLGTMAKLKFDSTQISFGQVKAGSAGTSYLYIYDTGTGPMTINQTIASPSNAFRSINKVAFPRTLGKKGGFMIDTFVFSPTKVGLDTAVVTLTFNETSTSRDTTIVLIGEGLIADNQSVAETTQQSLTISPNPSHGVVTIQSSIDLNAASYEVIDAVGHSFATQKMSGNSIDLSALPNGTYFLRITPKQGVSQTRRIVIEH